MNFLQKSLLIAGIVTIAYVTCVATAQALVPTMHSAETDKEKIVFGAKIQRQQTSADVVQSRTAAYEASASAPRAQIVKQYDIPIRNNDVAVAPVADNSGRTPLFDVAPTRSNYNTVAENWPQHNIFMQQEPRFLNRDRNIPVLPLHNPNSNSNIKKIYKQPIANNRAEGTNAQQVIATTKATTTTVKPKLKTAIATTPRPSFISNFISKNPFNIFLPNFWNLSNPLNAQAKSTTTTKHPPKKYQPKVSTTTTTATTSKLDKFKVKSKKSATFSTSTSTSKYATSLPSTSTSTSPSPSISTSQSSSPAKSISLVTSTKTVKKQQQKNADGPFRIALPTFNLFNSPTEQQQQQLQDKEKGKRATVETLRERFNCPQESEVRFQLFPKICKIDQDCSIWKRDELCCEIFGAKSCVAGAPKPLKEFPHAPLLGLIPRKCPTRPLAELWWELQECETDMDCWPRICCPDGRRRYCRTSQPELETIPVPVKRSLNYLTEYLECTPPPPRIFDLHPKACTSTLDCFPNVCCQEAGLKHCRPPKKSVLTLMANVLNVDFVKRITQNIVIKR